MINTKKTDDAILRFLNPHLFTEDGEEKSFEEMEGETMNDYVKDYYDLQDKRANADKMIRGGVNLAIGQKQRGTQMHENGLHRIEYLLKKYKELKGFSHFIGYENKGYSFHDIIQGPEEKANLEKLDNHNKHMYRIDIFLWKNKVINKGKENQDTIMTERRVLEIDGEYHNKWLRMVRDGFRDDDMLKIIPGLMVIRFHIEELIPVNSKLKLDYTSSDYDLVRKILFNRNYFSTADKIDQVGKPCKPLVHYRSNRQRLDFR